jgi:hypothetical protein
MKNLLVLAVLIVSSPAMAIEPAADTAAQAFAHAWIDRDSTISVTKLAMQEKFQHCIASGAMTQEKLDAIRPKLELYQTAVFEGFARVQERVAQKAQELLSDQDLRALARTMASPIFRTMRRDSIASMTQKLVPAIPGCGDDGTPVTLGQLGSSALPHLRPAEIAELRTIVVTPAWQHLVHAMPQLMPVMVQGYRDEVAHALQVVGASQAAQDKARSMPSPVVLDPPATTPAP